MAKNSIRDYSATASQNTDIDSIDIDENCPASNLNNSQRALMAHLKNVSTGAVNLETPAVDQLNFGDNAKAIFGAGSDLQIFHDPANGSIVKDNGVGRLLLDSENGTGISLTSGGIAKTMISATKDGDVKLYNNGSEKLATTSTGVDITGTVTADGLISEATGSATSVILAQNTTSNNGAAHLRAKNPQNELIIGTDNHSGGLTGTANASFLYTGSTTPIVIMPNGSEKVRITSDGSVGIGTSPSSALHVNSSNDGPIFDSGGTGNTNHALLVRDSGNNQLLRVNNDGNVLVGKNSSSFNTAGIELQADAELIVTRAGTTAYFNRLSSDGSIAEFYKGGSAVGSIGVVDGDNLFISSTASAHAGLKFNNTAMAAFVDGADSDNTMDIGNSVVRFDDIFATNGTIQTSDQNEKQNIASLTSAEMTAAKAISKLFKTFKWQDKVAAKGDAARTHTGVIAQEVQTAMTDAGLDASNYAFWCSDTWWETSTDVAAVESDEEAGIEARDAYTRIDTYQTADEAPEGATERTRLGIRYPELLAFVGAATEQRLADIETRLTALEA